MPELITVEVVYALPTKQPIISLKLPSGSTVRQAIEASGLLQKHAEIDLAKNKIGIFAKLSKLDAPPHPRIVRSEQATNGLTPRVSALHSPGGREKPPRSARSFINEASQKNLGAKRCTSPTNG